SSATARRGAAEGRAPVSIRRAFWLGGVVVAALLAGALRPDPGPGARVLAFAAGALGVGLAGERGQALGTGATLRARQVAHASLVRAGEWSEREAARWRARVNVVLPRTYFAVVEEGPDDDVEMTFVAEGEGVGPFEARAVTKALIDTSRAAARLGFSDADD